MGTHHGRARQAVARSPGLAGNLKPPLIDKPFQGAPDRRRTDFRRNVPPHIFSPGAGDGSDVIKYASVSKRHETISRQAVKRLCL